MWMWVIYERPADYPNEYVLRRWLQIGDKTLAETFIRARGRTADDVRPYVPAGLNRIQAPGDDPDPCIFEVWA
jgi:hypothetical protein